MTIEKPLWLGPNPTTGEVPEYSAQADRQILATLFTEGVGNVQAGQLAVTQRAAGANMTVEVAAGTAYVTGDDVAQQGLYRCDISGTESVLIGAAPASNSRIDLVVARIYDAQQLGGTKHGLYLEVVPGTAAASPVVPAVPNSAIPLAQILVAAGATSIQNAAITDRRAQSGANSIKVATSVQPMTTAQRDALSGSELFDGRVIDNITLAKMQIRRSGAWVDVAPTLPQRKAQGSYGGDNSGNRFISVGFTPDLVLVSSLSGQYFGWMHRSDMGYSQSGVVAGQSSGGYSQEALATNGFTVSSVNQSPGGVLNNLNQSYAWTAFKFL